MQALDDYLQVQLNELAEKGLRRHLRRLDDAGPRHLTIQGRTLLNFSSNDYLGLSTHPAVLRASREAIDRWGTGSRASRLVCGSLGIHHELEETLANWKQTEAALLFNCGFSAAIGVIPALAGPEDLILADRLVHACCLDGARLSRARLRVFRHNDLDHLEHLLHRARKSHSMDQPARKIWILAESIYSMDGDRAPLKRLVELKERFGAWLMLDEAHATGLFGAQRTGLAEEEGVSDWIDVHLGTLGKALASSGGYVCGSHTLIDDLVNRARSLIYSTAPPPSTSAAALAAIRIVQSDEGAQLSNRVWARARQLYPALSPGTARGENPTSAILPMRVGGNQPSDLSAWLFDHGVYVPAIRYPTVPVGEARLRFTVNAAHTEEDVQTVRRVLAETT